MKKNLKNILFYCLLFLSYIQLSAQITGPIPVGPDEPIGPGPIGPANPSISCEFTFQLKLNGVAFTGNVPAEGAVVDLIIDKQGGCDLNIDSPLLPVGEEEEPPPVGGPLPPTVTNPRFGRSIKYKGIFSGKYKYEITIIPNTTGSVIDHSFILKMIPFINGVPTNSATIEVITSPNVILVQSGNSNPTHDYFYKDVDEDGFGAGAEEFLEIVNAPNGYVNNNLDKCPNEFGVGNGCPDHENDLEFNYVRSSSYDIDGRLIGESKAYFDDLGKGVQTQTYDVKRRKIWATETRYDAQGRPALQTMSAPVKVDSSPGNFEYQDSFIQTVNGTFTNADFEADNKIENPTIVSSEENTLGWYYSTANDSEPLQDITTRPYSRTIYSDLMPGSVKQTIGGNKINGQWKRGYSFSMPAAQEMQYVFGYTAFPKNPEVAATYDNISTIADDANNYVVWLRATKTVVEDIHENESVVFTDADGKTLGAARSGWRNNSRTRTTAPKQYEVLSLIGEQKYVDIHIPAGCNNTAQLLGAASNYKVYDLKTEQEVAVSELQKKGFYRIEYTGTKTFTKKSNLTYIKSDGTIHAVEGNAAVGVRYKLNYYDFSLNEYNDIGQLTTSLQPIGFDDACFNGGKVKGTVAHKEHSKSTFTYDVLGQLVTTTSPDEGTANFKYRKDGQIRFSQNSKQAIAGEFSYTNYDELGRPVESGVFKETNSIKFITSDNLLENVLKDITIDDDGLPNQDCKEQHFTTYDFLDDKTDLNSVHTSYVNPSFLAGNVAKTSNENSITYYSYDVYGRVQWIVQKLIGFSDNDKYVTIDYEYDPVTSQVLQVIFQKYVAAEKFIHRYTYDVDSQELVKVETSTNGTNYTTHADYEYYETGAMKRTVLAKDNHNPNGIQGIDYVYNLAGQLKAINHPNLNTEANRSVSEGRAGEDLFGMTLDYYNGDYRRDTSRFTSNPTNEDQYNGNIKAMAWNTDLDINTDKLQYSYKYDRNNWLTEANFHAGNNSQSNAPENLFINSEITSTYVGEATNSIILQPGFEVKASNSLTFSAKTVSGSTNGSFAADDYKVYGLQYDANGNITHLNRNKNTEGVSNEMDKLTYHYDIENKPNQLLRVQDDVTNPTNAEDIKNQGALNNYRYNDIGQLTNNEEEQVSYEYNVSGLVTLVKYNGKNKVRFYYNDKNFRTKKVSYKNDGTTVEKTTIYVRDLAGQVLAIYEDQIQKELPIYGASRLGVYNKTTNTSVYQLTDHLGNVRAVIAKDGNGNAAAITSATDYYPFGMAMPNRKWGANGYRYAYQGQEVDPETGKEAFQLRLWDGRIGRWLTTDPAGQYASPYMGMGNNPISRIDPDGGMDGPGDGCCGDVDGGFLDEVVIGGKSNNFTGYEPTTRDWEILDLLRINSPTTYSNIKSRYDSGNYYKLGGGNWGGFSSQFEQGWSGRNNYPNSGTAEFWSNFSAATIGGTLTLATGSTLGASQAIKGSFNLGYNYLFGSGTSGTSTAASGNLQFGTRPDIFLDNASLAKPLEGFLDVAVHGSSNWVRVGNVNVTAPRLAQMIMSDRQFVSQSIRLLSCHTGSLSNGFAYQLSRELGVGVIAPNHLIWAHPSGALTIGPTALVNTGRFIGFGF